ncbi:quinone oxidoreductase-like [Dendronephthya gigantea]|uniref:quinone oxidoreductase-like n=1 Tax=Dendronephthya gigantea TaxID=151771 RepID=UPI001069F170|nr:quinone oxidoreductase-like [Dendronephthya gigantea]XP_028409294.1 quinone oxidoreductase-like [Dendronephthya gigantea]XP_028409295.1 quinone oxidoreductase-like [Dendronephthya gigantea]
MKSAKAIQVLAFGGPEVLQFRDVPIQNVGKGQVLVKLFAAGVNPVDTYIRSGTYARKPTLPYTPGADGAGIVKTVGEGVSTFKEGDRVYVHHANGTYAQFAVCDQKNVNRLHPKLTFNQGAALGVPYLTAYRALFHKMNVKPQETIFIHGASGGVGVAAVQLARAHGMRVLGTAGTELGSKVVKEAGAHEVFNHRESGYLDKVMTATENRGADVILENLANVNLEHDLKIVADHGRIGVVGNRGSIEINPRLMMMKESSVIGVLLHKASQTEIDEAVTKLEKWAEDGLLKPIVGKTFKLIDAPKAHKEIIEGSAQGKLVLEID